MIFKYFLKKERDKQQQIDDKEYDKLSEIYTSHTDTLSKISRNLIYFLVVLLLIKQIPSINSSPTLVKYVIVCSILYFIIDYIQYIIQLIICKKKMDMLLINNKIIHPEYIISFYAFVIKLVFVSFSIFFMIRYLFGFK